MKKVGRERRPVVGTLDIDKRRSQVTQIKQVADENLSTCVPQDLRASVVPTYKGANRETLSPRDPARRAQPFAPQRTSRVRGV